MLPKYYQILRVPYVQMKKNIRFLLYSNYGNFTSGQSMVWKNGHLFGSAFCLRGSAVYHRNEGRHDSEEISITGTSYQVSAEIVAATLKWMN
jgi:hypothetical protein